MSTIRAFGRWLFGSNAVPTPSQPGEIKPSEFGNLARQALIVGFSAILVWLPEQLSGMDFGQWTPFVTAAIAALSMLGHRWASGPSK